MDLIEAINSRKSVRAYKPDPVPKAVLQDVLKTASRAPSGINYQPWEFVVVTGDTLRRLTAASLARLNAGETPTWEIGGGSSRGPLPETYRERAIALSARMYGLLGIKREDRQQRMEWSRQGFRFFGAPAAIIITMDKAFGNNFFDLGLVTQTIALAALHHGLGTCIQGQGVMYPQAVREVTGIPESKYLVISLAIGYPDWAAPVNKLHSDREPLEKTTTWHGFE